MHPVAELSRTRELSCCLVMTTEILRHMHINGSEVIQEVKGFLLTYNEVSLWQYMSS